MSDQDQLSPLDELSALASIYMKCAQKFLLLDSTIMSQISGSLGGGAVLTLDGPDLTIYFLFPNLTDEERTALRDLVGLAKEVDYHRAWAGHDNVDAEEKGRRVECYNSARAKYAEAIKCPFSFEQKLTETQLKILDTSLFNPDADEEPFWDC